MTKTSPNITTLRTQAKRAAFVRAQMREQGLTCDDLADLAGKCLQTALGFNVQLHRVKKAKGVVSL